MQKRKRTFQWLLWLLLGTLSLLAGCVAPDGSVFRFQQTPNGTIVGWQVDAPTVTDEEPIQVYLPRPILFNDGGPEMAIQAVYPGGSSLGIAGNGLILGWSHKGDRFAYVPMIEGTLSNAIAVAKLGREEPILIPEDRYIAPVKSAQSFWSPDDRQIALLRSLSDMVLLRGVSVVDSTNGEVTHTFDVPSELMAKHNKLAIEYLSLVMTNSISLSTYTAKLETLSTNVSWSPTGDKLLFALVDLMVIDIESGAVEIVASPTTERGAIAWAEWLPNSDGIVYAEYPFSAENIMPPPLLWRVRLSEREAVPLLTSEQMAKLGLEVMTNISFDMSPTGTYLSLLDIYAGDNEDIDPHSQLTILDLTPVYDKLSNTDTLQPIAQWELPGFAGSMVWGLDEQEVAFFMVSDKETTIEVMAWKEGTSRTIGKVSLDWEFVPEYLSLSLSTGFRIMSWIP